MPASFSSATFNLDGLLIGEHPVTSRPITLLSGQNLARGAVLGKITASGKYILSLSGAVDGSQTPDAVLAEATDASGGDVATPAYFTGGFDESKLVLGSAHTVASIREGLRTKGIHLLTVQTTY